MILGTVLRNWSQAKLYNSDDALCSIGIFPLYAALTLLKFGLALVLYFKCKFCYLILARIHPLVLNHCVKVGPYIAPKRTA